MAGQVSHSFLSPNGKFLSQGHAEDVINRCRFCYYVLHSAMVSALEYDALERAVRALWSVCVCGVGGVVGSDNVGDYARYIQLGVRPLAQERLDRDKLITERWMRHL